MVDPNNIPNNMTDAQLQEFLLFSVCVAGHNASITASALAGALSELGWPGQYKTPFQAIAKYQCKRYEDAAECIGPLLQKHGLGCYRARARTFRQLACSRYLDLRTCYPGQLEGVWGIGPKTSRFFIMYTRPEEQDTYAVLDVHVLKWMREQLFVDAPRHTPGSSKVYRNLELIFLEAAEDRGLTACQLDEQLLKGALS